jgi:hypothetical protein
MTIFARAFNSDNFHVFKVYLALLVSYWYQTPLGLGMPLLDSETCTEGGGVFIYARVLFPIWCHPWMDDETDGWMDGKFHKKQLRRPLIYVILVKGGQHLPKHMG